MPAILPGSFCSSCGDLFYPQRLVCPRCGSSMDECNFCGKGDVYSYTVIHDPATGFDGPYTVALVHLAEGAYVTARLEGIEPQAIFIGLPVEVADGGDRLAFRPRRSLVE